MTTEPRRIRDADKAAPRTGPPCGYADCERKHCPRCKRHTETSHKTTFCTTGDPNPGLHYCCPTRCENNAVLPDDLTRGVDGGMPLEDWVDMIADESGQSVIS